MALTLAAYDYKYEPSVWRKDVNEAFQLIKKVKTDYTVVDGQIVQSVATTWTFDSAIAQRSVQLPPPPVTFLYVDGSYRADPAFIFQKTHVTTTTYSAYGETSYQLTIDDYDVLNNKLTRTVSIVDGKLPLAPTVNSALSNLIQLPVSAELDNNCDSVPSTLVIDNAWAEDPTEAGRVERRALQRATAIVRRFKHGANPLMRIGHTVRLVDAKRALDARHMLTHKTTVVGEEGGADQTTEVEFWSH